VLVLVNFANRPTRRYEGRSTEGFCSTAWTFFTSWLLALLHVIVVLRRHCTTRRVLLLPQVLSIGEAGKGKLECD
jgi:hypothetical protein